MGLYRKFINGSPEKPANLDSWIMGWFVQSGTGGKNCPGIAIHEYTLSDGNKVTHDIFIGHYCMSTLEKNNFFGSKKVFPQTKKKTMVRFTVVNRKCRNDYKPVILSSVGIDIEYKSSESIKVEIGNSVSSINTLREGANFNMKIDYRINDEAKSADSHFLTIQGVKHGVKMEKILELKS